MSSKEYNYDEQGQFFPYFIFTIVALITLPLSYSLLKPPDEIENTAPRIKSSFRAPQQDIIDQQKNKQWRRERRLKRIITVGAGYLIMALMLYFIKISEPDRPQLWDPYSILKLSTSSSESQIKKRFRDLSRTMHPDKATPDPARNETIETINDQWVEITKAFKALTDEEVRSNYEKYGNPDGKQSFSIGIALPQLIVNEGSGKYVLLVYGGLLGVLLPWMVGSWWYGTQRLTKEKVLRATSSKLFKAYKEEMSAGDVVDAVSGAGEYDEAFGSNADQGVGKIEKQISPGSAEESEGFTLSPKYYKNLTGYEGVRRKSAALLWSYLGRVQLADRGLDMEKYEAAPIAHKLLECAVSIALAFGNIEPLLAAYKLSQCLVQAIPPDGSPLQQLPHITPEIARAIEGPASRSHFTLHQLMALPEYKRRKLCTDQPSPTPQLTPAEYNTAMAVARQLPLLTVEKAFFKVVGEKFITPGSLVQFVVKARVIPPGSLNVPTVNPKDLEDADPEEGDLDAILGRRSAGRSKGAQMAANSPPSAKGSDAAVVPPLAYAPYFARDHSPRYHILLSDSRMSKIAVPPFTMTSFDKPVFTTTSPPSSNASATGPTEILTPTFEMQTFRMQFQAPPQQGTYSFVMHIVHDSFLGADLTQDITLQVESAEKAAEMSSEEDISEPEEDSLAGQMAAMKSSGGGAGKKAKAKAKAKAKGVSKLQQERRERLKAGVVEEESSSEEEEDEESGTDEEESDTSETDTETEDED